MRLQPTGRRQSVVPRLEALEDRSVPACFLTQVGSTLTILGSPLADQVTINDDGTGDVSIRCDQDPLPHPFLGVSTINVKTLGGPDVVTYQLVGSVFRNHAINVDLGAGKDSFQAFLNQNTPQALTLNQHAVLSNSSLELSILGRQGNDNLSVDLSEGFTISNQARLGIVMDGGLGNDRLNVNATHGTSGVFSLDFVQGTNLAAQGTFAVRLLGGQGVDRTAFGFEGQLDGTLQLNTDGGLDVDTTVANIGATTTSMGTVRARVRGGRAHDNLTLNVRQPPGVCLAPPCTLLIDALLDGGPESATCHATTNVKKIHCDK